MPCRHSILFRRSRYWSLPQATSQHVMFTMPGNIDAYSAAVARHHYARVRDQLLTMIKLNKLGNFIIALKRPFNKQARGRATPKQPPMHTGGDIAKHKQQNTPECRKDWMLLSTWAGTGPPELLFPRFETHRSRTNL